ncbi:polysaccharide deacetylase family protein [Corynebacterium diphtheriae]|uniref:polysaccharide deacetylase family protein n=1 Tax=Corynebacterium diphtheriae TaxID=1717 RepID=UPI0008937BF4|nr:polysaccharide deacetylase family protein [Corynebacterium diphtheriae]AWR14916.1 putative secreted polysaccharide deacetylase [Corynebacterium diphtheriae]OFI53862.1 polysaccharide deacetylase [Corynebacterium diphtheriae]OWX96770.1 polysaccharide deacetylase [Corynebacterium diphtheriae]CAB0628266.1 polysaccharide deacetylase family protein [Corynebacterium diphtheriae]
MNSVHFRRRTSRTRRISIFLAVCLLTTGCAAGCTISTPNTPVSESDSSTSSSQSSQDVELTVDAASGMVSTNSPQLPIHVQWPVLEGHEKLSEAIAVWAEGEAREFIGEYGPREVNPSELNGSGEQVRDGDVVAMRLTLEEFGGANAASMSRMFFSSGDRVWQGPDVIAQDRRVDAARAVLDQLGDRVASGVSADEVAGIPNLFGDVLVEGDVMHVRLPQASVLASSEGIVEVDIPSAGLLSEDGKRLLPPAPVPSPMPQLPQVQSRGAEPVDCSVLKCVALTFDDGPGPYTSQILDTLNSHGVKATFFEIATAIPRFPEVVRRQVASGMEVGSHTVTHRQLPLLPLAEQQREADGASDRLVEAGAPRPVMMRPPYGAWNQDTKRLGYSLILWNVDSEDWKNRDAQVTTNNIMAQVRPGSIVLMHDIHPSTAEALPGIIDRLKEQGYTLVTVSQLLGQTVPGEVYYGR